MDGTSSFIVYMSGHESNILISVLKPNTTDSSDAIYHVFLNFRFYKMYFSFINRVRVRVSVLSYKNYLTE